MNREIALKQKTRNWSCFLYVAAVVFFCITRKSSFPPFSVLYPFFGLIALPGILFLMGRKARGWFDDWRRTACAGCGMLIVGYLAKVVVYWAKTAGGKTGAFYPFTTSEQIWVFFAGGLYLLCTAACIQSKRKPKTVWWLTVAISMIAGGIRPFTDFLCLQQACAFAPFFAAGALLPDNWTARFAKSKKLKIGSAVYLAGSLVICWWLRAPLKKIRPLLVGDEWVGSISFFKRAVDVGVVARGMWLAAALTMLIATFCLTPQAKIPYVTKHGKRAVAGFGWFVSVGYLTLAPVVEKANAVNIAVSAAMTLPLFFFAVSKAANRWLWKVVEMPERLMYDRERDIAPPGNSLYARHKWGIDAVAMFTLCFGAVAAAYSYASLHFGYSLIWDVDGLGQQYPMMFYCKRYIQEGFHNLLTTGVLHFPQWDFTLGFGLSPLDAIQREPFMLLSLFGNESNMEYLMDIMVLLRLYVCGLVFLWYCRTIGRKDKISVTAGALVYVFSGYALFVGTRQPCFLTVLMTNWMLILVGIERYLREKKYGVFVGAVFLQILTGYYFTFISSLMMAFYLLIRLICKNGRDVIQSIKEIGALFCYYCWGVCMGMITLLPSVVTLFGSARETNSADLSLYYGNNYYRKLLTGLALDDSGGAGSWSHISVAAIGVVACVILLLRHKKSSRPVKIGLIVALAAICLPTFGLLANGFAYVCNRWGYVFGFLAGMAVVEVVPQLHQLTKREKGIVMAAVLLYCAVCVTRPENIGLLKTMGLLGLCMTAAVVVMIGDYVPSRRLQAGVILVVTVATVSFNSAVTMLPDFGGYATENISFGKAYDRLSGSMDDALSQIEDNSFYRISTEASSNNVGMALGYRGTNSYFSINPSGISSYLQDLCMASQYQSFRIMGLNDRTAPSALAGVKYYVTENRNYAPYGFRQIKDLGEDKGELYVNDYALPVGYTYTDCIDAAAYAQLTPLEKQQVMLRSAVVDQVPDGMKTGTVDWHQTQLPVTMKPADGVKQTEKGLSAVGGGSVKVTFEGKANCESYLVFENFKVKDNSSKQYRIYCASNKLSQKSSTMAQGESYYLKRDALIYNLGYSEEAQTECLLKFYDTVEYTYDKCYLVCVPMENYPEDIARRQEVALENLDAENERIYGTINTPDTRLLTFAVPYADGWSVLVDGEEAQLLQVNVMYCGVVVPAGEHTVVLSYRTPGGTAGLAVSCAAVAAWFGWALVRRSKQKKQKLASQGEGNV